MLKIVVWTGKHLIAGTINERKVTLVSASFLCTLQCLRNLRRPSTRKLVFQLSAWSSALSYECHERSCFETQSRSTTYAVNIHGLLGRRHLMKVAANHETDSGANAVRQSGAAFDQTSSVELAIIARHGELQPCLDVVHYLHSQWRRNYTVVQESYIKRISGIDAFEGMWAKHRGTPAPLHLGLGITPAP